MKYNLGAGGSPIDGYKNLDIKTGQKAYPMDIPDGSADEIRASHLLEHFGMNQTFTVLSHWVQKLKAGGILKIAVPDFEKIVQMYQDGSNPKIAGYLMGGQVDEDDYHRAIFDKTALKQIMERAGIENIQEWKDVPDCSSLPVSLNLMGTKKSQSTVQRTLSAVVSMPRLCFTDTMNCIMSELVVNRIPVMKGCGVFWSQVLTRMMQQVIDGGDDYILTLDYDSWFRFSDVQKLLTIMERHKELDAIIPMQMKRETGTPMMGVVGEDGKPLTQIPFSEFEKDYIPTITGHFGLTIFRCSSLKKLKKPWFWEQPNKDGEWEEGRMDSDIYFWHNFRDCGLKAGIAPGVVLGHLQLVCTFPGTPMDNFKPIHVAIGDLPDETKLPEHCR